MQLLDKIGYYCIQMDDNMDRLLNINEISWATIQKKVGRIDDYQTNWTDREDLSMDQLLELRELATIQSIGSSTRIEGSQLQDEEIASLVENMSIQKLESRDEQEVAGYFNALQIILEGYEDIPLTINIIKGLHKQLMQYSTKDEHHRGKYKTLSNQVVATLPNGDQRTIFKTTPPMQVETAMEEAVTWYNHKIEEGEINPLIVIGTFIYEFLTIHPFQDGNGRLSRLLTNFLLLKNGYDFIQYASLEQEMELYKGDYYKSLMLAQRFRGADEEIIGSWLIFLLKSIERVMKKLDDDGDRIVHEPRALYLNRRQKNVLNYFERNEVLSVGDIDRLIPEVSRNTLKYDLSKLTEEGLLVRKGKGRGTVYEAAKR